MTKNYIYSEKHTGDQLSATEWNNLAQDVSAAVDAINNGAVGSGSGSSSGSSAVSVTAVSGAADPTEDTSKAGL